MVVSTQNKGWRQPQSAQGSKANKDTFLCLAKPKGRCVFGYTTGRVQGRRARTAHVWH